MKRSRYITATRAKVWGQNVAEVLLGSNEDPSTDPTTAQIAAMGPQALSDFALSIVRRIFPSAAAQPTFASAFEEWKA
jgi:hypothetical protein